MIPAILYTVPLHLTGTCFIPFRARSLASVSAYAVAPVGKKRAAGNVPGLSEWRDSF